VKNQQVTREQLTDQEWESVSRLFEVIWRIKQKMKAKEATA
jgi:hypothetical protein